MQGHPSGHQVLPTAGLRGRKGERELRGDGTLEITGDWKEDIYVLSNPYFLPRGGRARGALALEGDRGPQEAWPELGHGQMPFSVAIGEAAAIPRAALPHLRAGGANRDSPGPTSSFHRKGRPERARGWGEVTQQSHGRAESLTSRL